jgi:hypothetical protein
MHIKMEADDINAESFEVSYPAGNLTHFSAMSL